MKIKNNVNYFAKNNSLKFVGVAMVALGFLLYYFGWGWPAYILMCVCIPLGAALFIVGSSGRSGDDDIDEYIAVKMRDLDPKLDINKDYAKRVMKHYEAMEIEGYEYRDGLMFKKTKVGSVRSSEYVRSVIYFLEDAFHITSRRISIISEEDVSDNVYELSLDEVDRLALSEESKRFIFRKTSFSVKDTRLCVIMKNGEKIELPIHDDLRSEQIVESANRILENYRKAH